MPSITFSTYAGVFDFQQVDPESGEEGLFIEDAAILKTLDGLSYDEEVFADFLFDGEDAGELEDAGISGGSLDFTFDSATGRLIGRTEYQLERALNPDQIAVLKNYTIGQWSDGIGANFFQERMRKGLAPQLLVADESAVQVEQRAH
ncbi:hypothetical protein [Duganella sp. S19_KUP01_CR8]|uniref:hypothetical protein n=1 Tax=Duganella sp. S19_KUP01_CR8 TaxID=3025502 RepID=UPI002FCDD53A